jgi:hypothetical protein
MKRLMFAEIRQETLLMKPYFYTKSQVSKGWVWLPAAERRKNLATADSERIFRR